MPDPTVYATASDVIDRWIGQGPPASTTQVGLYVGDAHTLIRREFPDLDDDVAGDDGPTAEQVKLVIVAMVTRVYRNPEGIRSRSIGGPDDFGGAVTYSGDNPGALEITDLERAILRGAETSTISGLFTISTTRGDCDLPDRYLDVVTSEPIPHVPIEDPNW